MFTVNFQILTILKIYVKSFQKLYFKATKQDIHNEAMRLKFKFEFWFDLKLGRVILKTGVKLATLGSFCKRFSR